jgi:hypothetical protein
MRCPGSAPPEEQRSLTKTRGGDGDAKADNIVTVTGRIPIAVRNPQVNCTVVPAAAPQHPSPSKDVSKKIRQFIIRNKVRTPIPNIASQVTMTERTIPSRVDPHRAWPAHIAIKIGPLWDRFFTPPRKKMLSVSLGRPEPLYFVG